MSDEVLCGAHTFGEFYALGDSLSAVKHIKGSSLTIPGQARDLGALLAASKFSGGMIPIHGQPEYDEDLAHGLARVQAESMDYEELSAIAIGAIDKEGEKDESAKDAESDLSGEDGKE